MEKLKLSIEAQLTIMEMHQLTPEEMMVIELLFLAGIENKKEFLIRYAQLPIEKHKLSEVLLNLQNKGVILKSFKVPAQIRSDFDFESIPFNELFLKRYRKLSGELGNELFWAYPGNAVINGVDVPMRNWAKYFNSEDEFYFQYGKAIGFNTEKHKEVLELIDWSKKNGGFGLNMNIGAFVVSKMWLSIKEYKEGDRQKLVFDNTVDI